MEGIDPGYILHIKLEFVTNPAIWRTLRVPKTISLHALHLILQKVFSWPELEEEVGEMSWLNEYDYAFRLDDHQGTPEPKEVLIQDGGPPEHRNSKARTLAQIWGGNGRIWRQAPAQVTYQYGGWSHDIQFHGDSDQDIESFNAVSHRIGQHALVLAGGGHPVVEDCDEDGWKQYKVRDRISVCANSCACMLT